MNNQYIPLSDLFSIIKISLNNPGIKRTQYRYENSADFKSFNSIITSENIYQSGRAPQKVIIPTSIINKIVPSPFSFKNHIQTAQITLYPDNFYNSKNSNGIKYILEMRSRKDEHFQNMEELMSNAGFILNKEFQPRTRDFRIKDIKYKLRRHILNNLLDKGKFTVDILVEEKHFAEHYFSKIKFDLKIGLTHNGLGDLILLEKMSANHREFLDILEFLYHDCDYIPLGRT